MQGQGRTSGHAEAWKIHPWSVSTKVPRSFTQPLPPAVGRSAMVIAAGNGTIPCRLERRPLPLIEVVSDLGGCRELLVEAR